MLALVKTSIFVFFSHMKQFARILIACALLSMKFDTSPLGKRRDEGREELAVKLYIKETKSLEDRYNCMLY